MIVPSGFRGGSVEAVAALADQVAGTSGDGLTVATELFSVADTLRGEGALRRFATDNAVALEARTGLVNELFAGQVSAATLALVTDAVARRWRATRDLADALEHCGVIAAVRSTGQDAERLVDELFSVRRLVSGDLALRDALSDSSRTTADKSAMLGSLLDGKALPATVELARQALSGSYRTPALALEEYEKVAADVQNEGVATVTVARPLAEADATRLSAALSRQYGRPVHLNVVVDPEVVGGIKVAIGDDVIDGTVSSRLAEAQRLLAG